MARTLARSKKRAPVARSAPDPRIAIVDEFGELERQKAEFKPVQDRASQLLDIIRHWFLGSDANTAAVVSGKRWSAQVGPAASVATIDKSRLFRILGKDRFLEICSIPVSAVEALPFDLVKGCVSKDRTGKRPVKAVLRGQQ